MSQSMSHAETTPSTPNWKPSVTLSGSKNKSLIKSDPDYQAYQILHLGFVVAPLAAGFDKFTDLLVDWDKYLAPIVPRVTGIAPHTFMQIVGVIEIMAGIGVALKPKLFGYVVSAWLLGIVVNLLMTGQYFDIALRDFGLSLGALALARLSIRFDRGRLAQ